VILYPAHGPGSACGKNIGKETFSTIGQQKKFNYALQEMTREEFIAQVTDGILPPPQNFYEDARINREGYDPIEDVIKQNSKPLSTSEFKDAIKGGAVILDTRTADHFEKGFIPGSINIGLNGQFAVWVGTLIDITKNLVLITEHGQEEEAILRLARVGYEKVSGFLKGGIESWNENLDTITSVNAEEAKGDLKKGFEVLDVRKHGEWAAGHLEQAKFLPLTDFPDNFKALDKSKTYIVHCGGGYRSMTAISIMKNHGFKNLINVYGGFGAMEKAGLAIVRDAVII
jgi:hydroxyacylglutathione hydrolase